MTEEWLDIDLCQVVGCLEEAVYDVTIPYPNAPDAGEVEVAMCRDHGDLAVPGPCTDDEQEQL